MLQQFFLVGSAEFRRTLAKIVGAVFQAKSRIGGRGCQNARHWPVGAMIALIALAGTSEASNLIDFEDLPFAGGSNYENGPNLLPAASANRTFTSGGVTFSNYYNVDPQYGSYWGAFGYSKVADNADHGVDNYTYQYGAITGGGVVGNESGGSKTTGDVDPTSTYAVADTMVAATTITFTKPETVKGAYFTNTAYTYYTMKNGSDYSLPFDSGSWFNLTISGCDSSGNSISSKVFPLASGTSIVDTWQWVDLSTLGEISGLKFSLTSSDADPTWGMNTPAYFAMDNLTVLPEPSTFALVVACGLTAIVWRRWRRKG